LWEIGAARVKPYVMLVTTQSAASSTDATDGQMTADAYDRHSRTLRDSGAARPAPFLQRRMSTHASKMNAV
jgi:hypothetical protein